MQTHADFIFHLDEPREQFGSGRRKLRGWIAAQHSLGEIRLRGETERVLPTEARPDVRVAFPNYVCATGFIGERDSGRSASWRVAILFHHQRRGAHGG